MKFILTILTAFLVLNSTQVKAENNTNNELNPINCAPQLQNSLTKILQLPESRKLMATIQKEGEIQITLSNNSLSQQFGAFWDTDNRLISVNLAWCKSEGELIKSILFEMHNALVNSKLNHLDELARAGQISKDKYVESVEYLEYQNSVNASKIVEKGIQLGVFPVNSRMMVYRNFEEHYRIQHQAGHSGYIAQNYDYLIQNKI